MVRHIVLWSFKPGMNEEEKVRAAARIKRELEELPALIPQIVSLKVATEMFGTCNSDVALVSSFKTKADLRTYIDHPEHKRVGQFVRSVLTERKSADFEE